VPDDGMAEHVQGGGSSYSDRTRTSTSIDLQIASTSSSECLPSQGDGQQQASQAAVPSWTSYIGSFFSFPRLSRNEDDIASQDDDLALLNSPPRLRRSSHSGSKKNSGEKKPHHGGGRGRQKKTTRPDVENPPDPSSLPEEIKSPLHLRKLRICDLEVTSSGNWEETYTSLPPNLCDLEVLIEMDAQNRGWAEIPEVFFSAECEKFRKTLMDLNLSKNSITVIPSDISSLASLQRLNLSENQIDVVPDGLFNLTGLEHLDLSQNNLFKVPDAIRQLSTLTSLDVQGNHLRTFPPLSWFDQLRSVNLSKNELESFDVGMQCTPSVLVELNLSGNKLYSIPDDINELSALEVLVLSNNSLREVPPACFGIATLQVLDLDGNAELRLEGSIAATNDISVLREYFHTLHEVTTAFEMANMREYALQRDTDLTRELYECLQLPQEFTDTSADAGIPLDHASLMVSIAKAMLKTDTTTAAMTAACGKNRIIAGSARAKSTRIIAKLRAAHEREVEILSLFSNPSYTIKHGRATVWGNLNLMREMRLMQKQIQSEDCIMLAGTTVADFEHILSRVSARILQVGELSALFLLTVLIVSC
jgi:Leucine-rich repeat (LRR) protein